MAELLWYAAAFVAIFGGGGLVMILAQLGAETIDANLRATRGGSARVWFAAVVATYCLGLVAILAGAIWLGTWLGGQA